MIDAIPPRLQACFEDFLNAELPPVPRLCLDGTVAECIEAHLSRAIWPLRDELVAPLVRHEVEPALET